MTPVDLSPYFTRLDGLMASDRASLRRRLVQARRRQERGQRIDKMVAGLDDAFATASARAERRPSLVPAITFPDALPVSQRADEIAALIAKHQVVVLAGETGSGKTTQLPKICLQLGRGMQGLIGHTQPRRLAARTVAQRIAEELGTQLGDRVGYQVRFNDQSSDDTLVKLMTDGILLSEIQNDPLLTRYDTLIIDEAHERSLNIDFLLGYLKQILPKRPDLKLIITSATIDLQRFSAHFNDAPIIEVSGRTHPVEIRYRPPEDEEGDLADQIVESVNELLAAEKSSGRRGGDILVFLAGEREIRETALALRRAQLQHIEVLPLYARLSLAEQTRVFAAHTGRRIVLATNVAETSITVPGIRYVIDPGLARISRYSYRTKIQRLPIEPVSQASANQRAGRCGRVSEGICIRLYSEQDFNNRPAFTDAEILRTNLAAVILQMLSLRMGHIEDFPFVDAPDSRLINDGVKLLQELQAINEKREMTALGRQLARLPVDPTLGRMLLAADKLQSLEEVLIVVSALAVQDPRERPADKQQAADEKHRRFKDDDSDFSAWINLWRYIETQRQDLSSSQFAKLCKREFLSWLRIKEWRDIHLQLRLALKDLKLGFNKAEASREAIHRALLPGLLNNLGFKAEDREYLGARSRKFQIFPGSFLSKKQPKWIVAAELLETSRLFGHTVAKIEPEWALDAAQHLVKREHFEPHYHVKSGQVMAFEKISLYGLTLVEKKRVAFGKIDPALAREVFIRQALVEANYRGKGKFFKANQDLIASLGELEAKSRRRDILVDDETIYRFFDERLPADIVNLAGFEHWRKAAEQQQPKLLYLTRDYLMQHDAGAVTEAQFPNSLNLGGLELPLQYHFEPNHADDGVSLMAPVSVLHQIPEHRLEWVVPGILKEKCVALIKGLPKQWRKQFVPVPEYTERALARMTPGNEPLALALGEQLFRISGNPIDPVLWQSVVVDDYYRMNIIVLDEAGKRIDSGRDLLALRERYRDRLQANIESAGTDLEQENLQTFPDQPLPEQTQFKRAGISIRVYPALVDEGDSVALRMQDNPDAARALHRAGLVKLLLLQMPEHTKYLQKELLRGKDIGLTVANMGSREQVAQQLMIAAMTQLVEEAGGFEVRTPAAFAGLCTQLQTALVPRATELGAALVSALSQLVEVRKTLKSNRNALMLAFCLSDIKNQLEGLFNPTVLAQLPADGLRQYPRYLKAILLRLEKAPQNVQRDKLGIAEWTKNHEAMQAVVAKLGDHKASLESKLREYRWLLEELRISLFAQTIKTLQPVSSKRLGKLLQEIKDAHGLVG
ncbi:ATP-dependent RNA helicase HrpA [Simiduia agarivorans]|uniref:ATP-dependent helicase HrpA n=1 Tax=Simiduia agarivorans (strain DSM 21679 / JCM 13881 / BCRC 17597 / SA1) TaxID=1117647 RepID=K4L3P4_SIMAS|nr:ATP-dependent RNA helicase HrpA [Simiduia agarivorans]AFV00823.1 ATP-dependent helicase HrpA [Simiduia agarivorans SA1 = DSM 21679]